MPETIPRTSVAIIRLGVTKLIPITNKFNSSIKAGIENTAIPTNTACRLNRNISNPNYVYQVAIQQASFRNR
jgi:hypothetical protein